MNEQTQCVYDLYFFVTSFVYRKKYLTSMKNCCRKLWYYCCDKKKKKTRNNTEPFTQEKSWS